MPKIMESLRSAFFYNPHSKICFYAMPSALCFTIPHTCRGIVSL
ncbi:hypothetical protein D1BOALGB6SA_7595 [Olavius sp. associated proteobacterium Delta 1]|nr:hypothetical protein D1BOALGB6SA_7595 [Olavius sp. associated proteobacterium Delta 1]